MVDIRIKPLEWAPLRDYGPDAEQAIGILQGVYGVFIDEDSAAGAIFAEWAASPDDFCMVSAKPLGRFTNWDEAKAAAQADYESRIRSTLSDAVAEREAEPVAWLLHKPGGTPYTTAIEENAKDWKLGVTPLYASPPASELEALRKRVDELEKALEPFAKEADQWEGYVDAEGLVEDWADGPESSITVGHLRAARRVREGGKVDG